MWKIYFKDIIPFLKNLPVTMDFFLHQIIVITSSLQKASYMSKPNRSLNKSKKKQSQWGRAAFARQSARWFIPRSRNGIEKCTILLEMILISLTISTIAGRSSKLCSSFRSWVQSVSKWIGTWPSSSIFFMSQIRRSASACNADVITCTKMIEMTMINYLSKSSKSLKNPIVP